MSKEAYEIQSFESAFWPLKEITFANKNAKIIIQNSNGQCSLITICNILILRGDMTILPKERSSVSYELLSQLLRGYLLSRCPDVDISAVLGGLPLTRKGIHFNPLFTAPTSFQPSTTTDDDDSRELKLFELAKIKLFHGWLVDPESPEWTSVSTRTRDYFTAINLITEADGIASSKLPQNHRRKKKGVLKTTSSICTDDERDKLESASKARRFLENTQSQLTYHGLFQIVSLLEPGSLAALFRNSQVSVIYRHPFASQSFYELFSLYMLVTDRTFLHEPTIVWESVEDIDGSGGNTFVDSNFVRTTSQVGDPNDIAIAKVLGTDEDEDARQLIAETIEAGEYDDAQRLYHAHYDTAGPSYRNYGPLPGIPSKPRAKAKIRGKVRRTCVVA